jgi:riboflavin synthase
MFTGLIEATGQISRLQRQGRGARITVSSDTLSWDDVTLGDSIAVSGACLTVVDLEPNAFSADLSDETLKLTCFGGYRTGQPVNLEKAMLPTDRLGGHLVSGHVDGVGRVVRIEREKAGWQIFVEPPASLVRYIATKGSITVDGCSLTVNAWEGQSFRLTIVPHTLESTILKTYEVGSRVHLEVDLIARYLEQLLKHGQNSPGLSMQQLTAWGYGGQNNPDQ